jgi:hypothetical protein
MSLGQKTMADAAPARLQVVLVLWRALTVFNGHDSKCSMALIQGTLSLPHLQSCLLLKKSFVCPA